MRVNGENPSIVSAFYQNQISTRQSRTDSKSGHSATKVAGDKVQLSARAREVQEAAGALADLPDVREKKVQQVKMEIESGTYRVVGSKIAMDMLRETFQNDMALGQIDMRV
jgi:negative regulator of flagellin synthesis FlgM